MSLPFDPQEGPVSLHALRHSTSHIMAVAVLRLFPEAKVAIGPPVAHGFYYDFELPRPLTEEDLPAIEEEMRKVLAEAGEFTCSSLSRAEAAARLREAGPTFTPRTMKSKAATAGGVGLVTGRVVAAGPVPGLKVSVGLRRSTFLVVQAAGRRRMAARPARRRELDFMRLLGCGGVRFP